jgi:hypothetical protein
MALPACSSRILLIVGLNTVVRDAAVLKLIYICTAVVFKLISIRPANNIDNDGRSIVGSISVGICNGRNGIQHEINLI